MGAWHHAAVFCCRSVFRSVRVPGRLPAGPYGPDHVYPCPGGLDGVVLLYDYGGQRSGGTDLEHALADIAAKATAPIGAGFTLLALITGSLWGKPMWGTWWVWDARLTSVLVLFFLYLGYMALRDAFDDPARGARASSILVLVGFVNVPVIKFSVDWWNTLHQPSSVLRMGGPTIHPDMLLPLLLMAAAFQFYFLWLLLIRIRQALMAQRLRALMHRQAQV